MTRRNGSLQLPAYAFGAVTAVVVAVAMSGRPSLAQSAVTAPPSMLPAAPAGPIAASPAASLVDSVRLGIEAATETGDLHALETMAALAERALAASRLASPSATQQAAPTSSEALLRHYHAYAFYRIGTLVLARDGTGKSRPFFDRAHDELDALTRGPAIPETYALLGAVYGMQIAVARIQMVTAIRLGPKSNAMMDRSVEAGPQNPRVWVVRGIGAFNTPGSFGGGMDKAETYLKKAIELFATDDPAPPLPAWGLAEAHVWLGRVYVARSQRDSARAEFKTALSLQPQNAWVAKTLLPSLDKP